MRNREPKHPTAVNHQGQFPSVRLSFNLAAQVTIADAVMAIEQATRELHLPPSIARSFQGSAQAFQNSLGSAPILILAALTAVYIILAMLYESTIHPITIISTLPAAGLGALLTLMLFGMPLDVIGIIGIILLIGIVKKNGIMLVDFALVAQREHGLSTEAAIHEACRLRFRPILMTTMLRLAGRRPADARHRHRLGNPPAARLRDRRRPASVAASDVDGPPPLLAGQPPVRRSCVFGCAGAAD
jgi:multidrug efflux pump subunit AcrB